MANTTTTRVTNGGYGTTPVRYRKIGLADALQEQQDKNAVAISEPSAMVQQAAQQSYAMNQGGMAPSSSPSAAYASQPAFGGVVGKFEPIPNAAAANPSVTDFTDMKPTRQFTPSGGWQEQENMRPYQHSPEEYKRNFEQMESRALPEGWGAKGNPEYSKDGGRYPYMNAPYDPSQYASLSDALNSGAGAKNTPAFKRDETKKDGGFFGWLKSLVPKSRPGKRDGETDDEYDARRTRNMQMVATLADAIRHMGNIVHTSKGAPLQIFNDPNAMIEKGAKERKAQRQKDAAAKMAADKAQMELTLKQQAAEADRKYKEWLMGLKDDAAKLGKDKFEYKKDKDKADAEAKAAKDDRDFKYKQERDKAKDRQTEERLNIAKYNATHKGSGRSGKGGSGSGGKYWFEDKNGKVRYQPNKTMWEQEYYREYGKLPEGESSVSKSTKTIDYKTGQETTTTERTKGASVTSQAAAAQNAAKAARNAKAKSSGSKSSGKPKSKNGYKNTKALGL